MECPPTKFDTKGKKCVISTRKADDIIKTVFKGKHPRQPVFYIKYGPPASGKGGIMEKVLKKDMLSLDSLVTIEVDSIIESNKIYLKKRSKLEDPVAKSELYWQYRGEADIISDQILNIALIDHYDIGWETTGMTIAWTVREIKRIQKQGYTITLVYPLVPADTLVSRSLEREKKTGQTPAPEKQIRDGVNKAINNLKKLLDYVDNIYIYDNSGGIGEEDLIIEINNVWDWTTEDNISGPGLKRVAKCKCKKIQTELAARFAKDIISILGDLCQCRLEFS
jgi:predicted ABC-type ATPase